MALPSLRLQCQTCRRSIFEPLPEMHEGHLMTCRLVEYIERQALRRPFTHIAEEVGVDEKTTRNVFTAYREHREREVTLMAPLQIGIDEVKIDGAMRCVLVDMQQHCILDILPVNQGVAPERCQSFSKVDGLSSDIRRPTATITLN